ncbi:cell division protein FtsA [Bacillus kwashiorkori]|uniref:cell division protein FtsA n=1 Tax=Bacillus kwashiorkori TaxID=1522318 RepID=UPI00078240C5|nr:cell division protein FtsA [Bacillus kwashiorkori]
MDTQDYIFSLDIGTRTIIGTIIEIREKTFVKHIVVKEHPERAMFDGQIHDVLAVANLIKEVKSELEAIYGPLKNAYVAAAGRALKTEQAKATIPIKGKLLTKEDIKHLELVAVQEAQKQLIDKTAGQTSQYFCVGYSVLYYYLDEEKIGNLIDQTGTNASVEVIATFLPKVVIDSLAISLKHADLELAALTLEPIAAIHVLIPPSMRRLNVALVDIGAGTSDIAITSGGTIVNYGMVPVAGDEITEAISDYYLLDFPNAEKVKRKLATNDSISMTDILGFEQSYSPEEIIQSILPTIEQSANLIVEEILRLNSMKSPMAVMLVGGGSLTPQLAKIIAKKLNLPENRVAMRGIEAIADIVFVNDAYEGPEFITPIGIGLAARKNPIHYLTATVNGIPVRLFEAKKLTVGDCLIAAGIKISQLYGKPGLAKIIQVNNQSVTIPGKYGKQPLLLLNGSPASFDDVIKDGDEITAEQGAAGDETVLTVKDLMEDRPEKIYINNKLYTIDPVVFVNGVKQSLDYRINDRDIIEYNLPKTIEEIVTYLQLEELLELHQTFHIVINGRKKSFPDKFSSCLYRNGKQTNLADTIKNGDQLTFQPLQCPSVEQLAKEENWQLEQSIEVFFNGEKVLLKKESTKVYRNGEQLSKEDTVYPGNELEIKQRSVSPFIFQDVFRFVQFELPTKISGTYNILINGQNATFYDPINPGDQLEIKFRQ